MSFYTDKIYPLLVSALGNPAPIREIRRRTVALAEGNVLEIGAGTGVNFLYYDPRKVAKIYALEPNPAMIQRAERHRRRVAFDVEFLDCPGERIPLPDGSVDTVVSTFTLCTIPGVEDAMRGIARVLRPGGKLIFFEQQVSPDIRVLRWQRRWEPLHHKIFSGLRLTRDISSLIANSGFDVEQIEAGYLARFPKSWAYCCWGTARLRIYRGRPA